jgi:DNA mismatch repair protein MutL
VEVAPQPKPEPVKPVPVTVVTPEPEKAPEVEIKEEIPEYEIIGEVYNCYVIVQLEDRVLMVDKHAAHERILFDELCKRMKAKTKDSQILMIPMSVFLPEDELIAIEEYAEQISSLGFVFRVDKTRKKVSVSEIPTELNRDSAEEMISELGHRLAEGTGSVEAAEAKYFEAKLYQASCKAAIKGGRVYSKEHLKWICDRLFKKPGEDGAVIKTCPHGRPVAFEIKKSSIERQFNRIQ